MMITASLEKALDSSIEGIYRFYLDKKLVHEEKNALTTMGRSIALKSLLGIIPNFANAIAYGIGDRANTVDPFTNLITDNFLQFEIGRTSVNGSTLQTNDTTSVLVYSGLVQDSAEYFIYEVGLFPSIVTNLFIGARSSTIFNFDQVDTFTQSGTASGSFMSANLAARIGTDLLYLPETNAANDYLQYFASSNELDYLDTFTSEDLFKLAGYNPNLNSSSVIFRMYSDDTNYYDIVFNTPSSSGYFITETLKGDASIIGNPQWSNINYVRFWETGGADGVLLDGLRINTGSYLIDTNTGLISRAVLSTPIRKPSSIPLTIEYSLNVGFNEGF
jgi:hypothetical protein